MNEKSSIPVLIPKGSTYCPLTYTVAKANSEDTSGSLKDILKEAHDVTFVTKDDSP